jgi:glyoxylase-like metal-dependent hydrolase (beta-lactamase superfamily II)
VSRRDVCDRLICLTLAFEYQPRRLSVENGGDVLLRLPVVAFVVHGPTGWLLLDTGLSPTMRDEPFARRIYRTRAPEFCGGPDPDPLLATLARCSVSVDEIAAVAVSHLHVDHTGGLLHFADGRPVFIQDRELSFGLEQASLEDGYVREDFADPALAWQRVDGDTSLVPGVDAVFTPGHTPGHMSYRVRLSDGQTWLLAMDAIDLQDGIDTDTPIGSSALHEGVAERRDSHERLMTMLRTDDIRLLPGHCPVVLPTLPGPPQGLIMEEVATR